MSVVQNQAFEGMVKSAILDFKIDFYQSGVPAVLTALQKLKTICQNSLECLRDDLSSIGAFQDEPSGRY